MAADDRTIIRRDGTRANDSVPRDPMREPIPREPMRAPAEDRSLGELLSELTDEVRTLVRQEVTLAKVELKEKATRSGRNIGMIAGGGIVAYVGGLAVVAAVILLLGLIMPYWLSALIVGAVLLLAGYAIAQKGLDSFKEMNFKPERTTQTLQEDKQWIKEEVKDMR